MDVGWVEGMMLGVMFVADCSLCTLDMPDVVHSVGRRDRTTL